MKILSALALAAGLCACSPGMPPAAASSASQEAAEFEVVRQEAARLIYGDVGDWRAASEQARLIYVITSADALVGSEATAERRRDVALAFKDCMDRQVARSGAYAMLGDVSYACAAAL